MVTLEGSPPKAEIYCCTHFKARRSFQLNWISATTEMNQLGLTILKAEIAYFSVLDFFPG